MSVVELDVCGTVPSVAVTVIGYIPGTVDGVIVTVADALLLVSAADVAVIVALPGSPATIVGAVYTPPDVIVPAVDGDTDHVTAVFVVFVTVALKVAVCGGQLSAASFGNKVDAEGLTLTPTAGALLLPQATSSPRSTSTMQSAPIMTCFDILRPPKPTMTIPASGNVRGSHGIRLSARRLSLFAPPLLFGPVVLIVSVTGCGEGKPAAIELKEQVTVASGSPLQAKVTALVNVVPLVAVTLKVEVAVSPESTVAGVVGVDNAKF